MESFEQQDRDTPIAAAYPAPTRAEVEEALLRVRGRLARSGLWPEARWPRLAAAAALVIVSYGAGYWMGHSSASLSRAQHAVGSAGVVMSAPVLVAGPRS